ncbi:hypothetical protein EVAR_93671_1 [Eumeta japonica]|uniref:Uncharacterized protein n=1 Tax=Eumeta variegata TaxID=151549 RepID=A0A4C1TQW1_EUMVA|nr:hypothetical protein EVAR_93671_1 [Eumeta japonica]
MCVHSEPAPSAMTALHQFGAEMLKLSRGLEASAAPKPQYRGMNVPERGGLLTPGSLSVSSSSPSSMLHDQRRRPSSTCEPVNPLPPRPRSASDDESQNDGLLAPDSTPPRRTTEVIIVPGGDINNCNGFPTRNGSFKNDDTPSTPFSRRSSRGTSSIVTWEEARRFRRVSSFGGARTALSTPTRNIRTRRSINARQQQSAPSPQRTPRAHHSRNSSVISRNSSRHGRILRLEQKATKVLGVVFFTFVVLWAPFLHSEHGAGGVSRMRETYSALGFRFCPVVGLRQFDGQSDILHHIQQSVQASVQKGAEVCVKFDRLIRFALFIGVYHHYGAAIAPSYPSKEVSNTLSTEQCRGRERPPPAPATRVLVYTFAEGRRGGAS